MRRTATPSPMPVSRRANPLTPLLLAACRDLRPHERIPADRLAAIGRQCGPAEVEAALDWLDELSHDMAAQPEWERDRQAEIARGQEALRCILCHVSQRHFDCVARGLESGEWRSRIHVAMALDTLNREAALPILRDALAREEDDYAGQVMVLTLARAESEGV